eukprot:Amastigsp_a96_3797.p4 type:complete len:131 gc:universal Amastigsp_a96_3797:1100-708(-)
MRVEPPTSTTSLMSFFAILASVSTCSTGWRHEANSSAFISSNLAREMRTLRSMPSMSDSTSISAEVVVESWRFARSHAVRRRRSARRDSETLRECFLLNCSTQYATRLLSKSSPPRCVLPAVETTEKMPS